MCQITVNITVKYDSSNTDNTMDRQQYFQLTTIELCNAQFD